MTQSDSGGKISVAVERAGWFPQARFGMFIHWGAYSALGLGEQVLFRDHLKPSEYRQQARRWNPRRYDPHAWAAVAKQAGMKYAVLTSKHHDGYCLFDSQQTDYTSVQSAPGRDLVGEYVEAFRSAGLRVGLYFSLADWNYPAYFNGPHGDECRWNEFREFTHAQVRELCTQYGEIDMLWFDGSWPHDNKTWQSECLLAMIRELQPKCLVNNRLGHGGGIGHGLLGDFGTPEHRIATGQHALWESCQTSTWRLWGWCKGERWRPADVLLDMLTQSASLGGNLLLNVGPKPDGTLPPQFVNRMAKIGQWMDRHGEAIYGCEPGVCEFITHGWQTVVDHNVYLLVRLWPGPRVHLCGLKTRVKSATLLSTGEPCDFRQEGEDLWIDNLPRQAPDPLCTVIRLECEDKPEAFDWAKAGLWQGDASRMTGWAVS